jgi:GTPase SAR1 family protein
LAFKKAADSMMRDTQDEYSILNSKHFIGVHGYMLVYSVGSKQSFEMMRIIRDKILNHLVRTIPPPFCWAGADVGFDVKGTDWVPIVIVGNKSDLRPEQRQVDKEQGRTLSEEFKCAWTEASAKYSENVAKAFELMIGEIEKLQNPSEPTGGNKCSVM